MCHRVTEIREDLVRHWRPNDDDDGGEKKINKLLYVADVSIYLFHIFLRRVGSISRLVFVCKDIPIVVQLHQLYYYFLKARSNQKRFSAMILFSSS